MKIFIGVAWPYANGPLHLGHVAGSLLAPDIFARYHRMKGDQVLMVSGSDEHGTPITLTAEEEGKTPQEIVDHFHSVNSECLRRLGISFDIYFRTSHPNHREVVHDFFLRLLEKGYIYKKTMNAYYCGNCKRFLPDRYLKGTCPHCGFEDARGDQCDHCGQTLGLDDLQNPMCRVCGTIPEIRETEHFFFKLSAFQDRLLRYVSNSKHWKKNVWAFTMNWLRSGLKDRPITRDLTWGVDVPLDGYEGKRIYVWFEAVIGYLSASKEWAERTRQEDRWRDFWEDSDARHYYFLGKDNIPFHTIIWPAMLMGYGGLNLPYDVPANEYLTLEGAQFSKSRGHAIWVPAFLEEFDPDTLRYYLAINMPEKKDADFSWSEFMRKNNDELVGTLGNFINRTLTFAQTRFGGVPEPGDLKEEDRHMLDATKRAFHEVSAAIEQCRFKDGMRAIMGLAHEGNRYLMIRAPWRLIKVNRSECATVIHTSLRVVKALSFLMAPYLPFAAQRVYEMLGYQGSIQERSWDEALGPLEPHSLGLVRILFRKIEDLTEEVEETETITIQEFRKLDIRVGRIVEVKDHPNAERLYVLKVDTGSETRQLVAGLKPHYTSEEMLGKHVVILMNLRPAEIRGIESQGMLLAAESDGVVSLLITDPEKLVRPGAKIT